jgi:hypothetical protein
VAAGKLDNRAQECLRIFSRNRVVESGSTEAGQFCGGEYSTVGTDCYPVTGASLIESRPRLRRYVHPELVFSSIRHCSARDIKPFVWRMHIQGSSAALSLFLWDECG